MWFLGACLLTALVLGAWLFSRREDLRAISAGRRVAVFALFVVASVTMGGFIDIFVLNSPETRTSQARKRHLAYSGRQGLKSIYVSERAYFEEKDDYATDFATMGFQPEPDTPYSFEFGHDVVLAPGAAAKPSALCALSGQWPDGTPLTTGLHGTASDGAFAALAAWVPQEGDPICWSVTSFRREIREEIGTAVVSPGEPYGEKPLVRK